MRVFANVFLVAFAVEALLHIVLSQFGSNLNSPFDPSGGSSLVAVSGALTALLTLASLPIFVLMGIHPGLRWRIFLPPCLVLSWISMGAMPLPIWFEASDAWLAMGTLEAGVALLSFALCRHASGGTSYLLERDALTGKSWSAHTAVRFTLLNFVVILPVTLLYLALSAAAGVGYLTEGFVELRRDGIHLMHREYRRDAQTVHLVAMMHIGDADFYRELRESLPTEGAITLAEGVTDDARLLSGGMSYGGVAAGLGLVEQPDLAGGGRELRYADVDVSSFSPLTLKLLSGVGRIFASETLTDGLIAYAEFSRMSSEQAARAIEALRHDLIDRRNAHLLGELEAALGERDVVVVPWGALHLPGIEAGVRDLGFVQAAEIQRRVVSW